MSQLDQGFRLEPNKPNNGRMVDGSEKPITEAMEAEEAIEYVLYWEKQKDKVNEHIRKLKEKTQNYETAEISRIDRKIDYHTQRLRSYTANEIKFKKSKSVNLASGRLSLRKKASEISIFDEMAFRQWTVTCPTGSSLMKITTEEVVKIDKKEVRSYIESTGNIPDGTSVVEHEDKFKIEEMEVDGEREKDTHNADTNSSPSLAEVPDTV